MLARPADQRLDVEHRHGGLPRLGPAARVEQLEHRQPSDLFAAHVDVAARSLDHLPALAPELLMRGVVLRAPLGIAQHFIGFSELAEARRLAGLRVIRVEALREQPIHAVNRLGLRVGADLHRFVVVDDGGAHGALVLGGRFLSVGSNRVGQ